MLLQPQTNCLSLVVVNSDAWNKLLVYCCNHSNLNYPILPAFLGKSLEDNKFIVIKYFPGETNFDRKRPSENDYFGWLVMNSLARHAFVSLVLLSTVPFIIQKVFKETAFNDLGIPSTATPHLLIIWTLLMFMLVSKSTPPLLVSQEKKTFF